MSDQAYIPTIRGVPLGSCSIEQLKRERDEAQASLERQKIRLHAIELAIRAKEGR